MVDGSLQVKPGVTLGGEGEATIDLAVTAYDPQAPESRNAHFTLSVLPLGWQNPESATDVNGDGYITPFDVLHIINDLNADGPRALPPILVGTSHRGPHLDVNGDHFLSSLDALVVVNQLNEILTPPAEGEANQFPGPASPVGFADDVPADQQLSDLVRLAESGSVGRIDATPVDRAVGPRPRTATTIPAGTGTDPREIPGDDGPDDDQGIVDHELLDSIADDIAAAWWRT